MYEVYIPLMGKIRTEKSWQKTISELKRARPDRVYIVYYRTLENAQAKKKAREVFKNNKDILENAGFKTGAWFCPTIGYGSPSPGDNAAEKHYRKIAGAAGGETHAFCPLDENFRKDLCDEFKGLAEMGTDTILLEDDFTLTGGKLWINNPGCLCDEHLRLLSERLGENVTRDKLLPYLITGKSNKYRKEYLKLMGETLLKIAEDIEKAVHSVSPDTRIGFSSNSASYHLEGASAFQIAETLAGKNKPFVRLTAAPYWKNGPSLNSTLETARMQGAWFTERGADVMTEGDTYPRPRFLVSAAELEMYDIILRADGNSTGILKYMLDYNSLADYETGYVDFHAENAELYKEIENRFKGENVGLRVLEYPHNTGLMDFDDSFDYFGFADHGILPLISQWFVTDNSLPTTYGKTDGAALVFGTNAQLVTDEDLNQGLILDVKAAKILSEKGIDVGFLKIESAPKPAGECFFTENEGGVRLERVAEQHHAAYHHQYIVQKRQHGGQAALKVKSYGHVNQHAHGHDQHRVERVGNQVAARDCAHEVLIGEARVRERLEQLVVQSAAQLLSGHVALQANLQRVLYVNAALYRLILGYTRGLYGLVNLVHIELAAHVIGEQRTAREVYAQVHALTKQGKHQAHYGNYRRDDQSNLIMLGE